MNSFIMGDEATYKGHPIVLSEVRNRDVLLAYTDIVGPKAGGQTVSLTHSEIERAIETGELTVL
jgi:hypothetical protein